jgi:hypothetical protein
MDLNSHPLTCAGSCEYNVYRLRECGVLNIAHCSHRSLTPIMTQLSGARSAHHVLVTWIGRFRAFQKNDPPHTIVDACSLYLYVFMKSLHHPTTGVRLPFPNVSSDDYYTRRVLRAGKCGLPNRNMNPRSQKYTSSCHIATSSSSHLPVPYQADAGILVPQKYFP